MGISRKIPVTILTGAVAAMLSCPGMVMAKTKMHTASDTKVTTVTSIRDIGGRSSTENSVVTVDTSTGGVVVGNEKKSFKKAFGRNFSKVKGSSKAKTKNNINSYLKDEGYTIVKKTNDEVKAVNTFANKRIRLNSDASNVVSYGADSGKYYDKTGPASHYLFSYDSEEQAEAAYKKLVKKYGKDKVLIDIPVSVASSGSVSAKSNSKGWGTDYMNLSGESEKTGKINRTVIVADIDTGINKNHEAFSGKTISSKSYNIITGRSNVSDDNGHGTATAGIIAESTPDNVQIMSIKALDDEGSGSFEDVMNSVEYAVTNGASVLNMSLGGDLVDVLEAIQEEYGIDPNTYIGELDSYLKAADSKGAVTVAASGNENNNINQVYTYPAVSEYTIATGSINKNEKRSSFSNYGTSLDYTAPGENVLVANYTGGFGTGSGTSFATPYITSAAAMVKLENPTYKTNSVKTTLTGISKDLGTSGKDKYFGNGVPIFKEEPADPDPVTPTDPVTPVNPDPVTPINPDPVIPVNPDPVTPVDPDPTNPTKKTQVIRTIKNNSTLRGYTNKKYKIPAKAKTKITMTSSNRNILVIDKNNFCKIKKSGTVKITMTAKETKKYQKATKTITLNVKKLDKTKKKCRYIKAKKVNKSQKTSKR